MISLKKWKIWRKMSLMIFLDKYLKENQVDLFDPEELNLDSDKGSNIIKFKPKGTMH